MVSSDSGFSVGFGKEVRDVIGGEGGSYNPPYSRDDDGLPTFDVDSKLGPGDINIRQFEPCGICPFDGEEPNTLD
ncbi:hypothetical protein SCP_1403550 [Sparassis crispa]|uniref:Uncharacterized protein n=1 Tax=Sparassis crispa TaxID=139825 RepID=A0A401H3E2_9APHY|nr:hypothetical protein SCP_1403550 [Sparassis crispa]GBE88947.1 hypothetical protein SCP_1403550 [Sparassis crispa]